MSGAVHQGRAEQATPPTPREFTGLAFLSHFLRGLSVACLFLG